MGSSSGSSKAGGGGGAMARMTDDQLKSRMKELGFATATLDEYERLDGELQRREEARLPAFHDLGPNDDVVETRGGSRLVRTVDVVGTHFFVQKRGEAGLHSAPMRRGRVSQDWNR